MNAPDAEPGESTARGGRSFGLRVRSALATALVAAVVITSMCGLTAYLARRYLLDQRQDLAVRQSALNAIVVDGALRAEDPDLVAVLAALETGSTGRPTLRLGQEWFAATVETPADEIPAALLEVAERDGGARQRVELGDTPYIAIALRLPTPDALYVELVPLTELRSTLSLLNRSLAVAAAVAAVGGALAGWWLAGRVLRPLANVTAAARSISEGDLSIRLTVHDKDLAPLTEAFNDMAEHLDRRITREMRFTSDVSHELRTPITAISSAVDLAKRSELSERAELAVGMIGERVEHLRRLVLDLLEISRFDAGAVDLQRHPTDVTALCREILQRRGVPAERVRAREPVLFALDRRRLERAVSNLVENAEHYAGGVTAIGLEVTDGCLVIDVDDSGPGIVPDEREAIFGRFHRGRAANQPDSPRGTGLGLALVDEQVRLHGGTVTVGDAPCGGARFRIEIPSQEQP